MTVSGVGVFAPGRVNLIGEHTDHSGGLVLPVAIGFGTTMRGIPVGDGISIRSDAFEGSVRLAADGSPTGQLPPWGRYVAAIASLLAELGRKAIGLEGTLTSTVPIGAGLSSSASLTVSVGLALCRAASFELPRVELAKVAQEAEMRAVGVPCGLMDPAISLLGRRGHALLLDCGSETWRHVPLPPELAVVVLDSGVRHTLEASGYATRRAELDRALAALGERRPADVSVAEASEAVETAGVDETAARRLRHVVSENERVREFVAILESPGRVNLERLGEVMRRGHLSLRDDFEVSTPELDLLVELADAAGAVGARLTGGGFGGSVVALVPAEHVARVRESVRSGYRERTGREATTYACSAVDGAADVA